MFNPFDLQNKTLDRTDISLGAKCLMIRLRNAAGRVGKIQYRVKKLAAAIGVCERQARYYIKELVDAGLVERKSVTGRANWWFIMDVYAQTPARACSPIKEQDKKKTTVQGNGFSSLSPKQPYPLPLVREILRLTGDKKSIRYWVGVVKKVPEAEIQQALSFLKIAMDEKIIAHPGAYLNALLIKNHPELRKKTAPVSLSTSTQRSVAHTKEPTAHHTPASHEESLAAIAAIKQLLARRVG